MSGADLIARLLGFERAPAPSAALRSAQDDLKALKAAVQIPYVWPSWRAGQPDWTPATLQGYAEAGYEGNSLVLACIRRRAQSAAFAPLVAYTGERAKPERLPDLHPLARLLRKPNPHQSWYEFMEQGITYLDLDGNLFVFKAGGWRAVGRAGRGTVEQQFPEALYLLRSDRVRVVPGRERSQPLLGYVYDPDDSGQWLSREPFLPEEVIHVKYPNPRDPFEGFGRGTSPLGAAAKQVDVDNSATSFMKTFFDQGVVPYGLLKSKQTLVDEEVTRIRDRLKAQYAGQQNWGEVMILDADADYQQMGMSFRDMTFGDLDARNEARICQVLDTPPILVGAKVGLDKATYSNYQEARAAFWQDALIPGVYQRLEDAFNLGLGTADVWLAYDYSGVPALRDDETKKAETAVRLFLGGLVRRGEGRALASANLGPLDPADDGFRAADQQQIGAPALSRTPVRVAGGGAAAAGDAKEEGSSTALAAARSAQDEGEKRRPFGRTAPTRDPSTALAAPRSAQDARVSVQDAKARAEGSLKDRLKIEQAYAPQIAAALEQQLRLALPKGVTAETVWQAEGRLETGKQAVSDVIYRMMREAAMLGLEAADEQVDGALHGKSVDYADYAEERKVEIGIDWTLVNSQALEWLKGYLFELVSRLNGNSREALRKAIGRWVENGLPLQDLIDELTPMFGPVRAEMIASTEVTRAFAVANLLYWQASGVVEAAQWMTVNDERVCFPADTLVETEHGPWPIDKIRPGQWVWTRQGLRRVKATSRRSYGGEMVTVDHAAGQVTATARHPFWTSEQGWLEAGQLHAGHTLETFGKQAVKVIGVRHFFLGQTANAPAPRLKIGGLARVALEVLARLYQQSCEYAIDVYNLEVDEVNEFYADEILVHNCPICAPLGGLVFGEDGAEPAEIAEQERRGVQTPLGEAFVHPGGNGKAGKYEGQSYQMPPAHTRCRCWLSPVV